MILIFLQAMGVHHAMVHKIGSVAFYLLYRLNIPYKKHNVAVLCFDVATWYVPRMFPRAPFTNIV